jgi:hypothetical protein
MSSQNPFEVLLNGISIDDFTIYAKEKKSTRFAEESDLDIFIKKGDAESFLMKAKVFPGRKPNYMPWTELFNINSAPAIDDKPIAYFDSKFEDRLLDIFSSLPDNTGDLFIEYNSDIETASGLRSGYPAAATRLGFKLFQRGFTWFKDWYFPEGHMEGGQKLQGEKSSDTESKKRQLNQVHGETKEFMEKHRASQSTDKFLANALERAGKIIRTPDRSSPHF